jgi:radical SAM superfamily enzyme YgiQ (UPF0313 family)
MPIFGIDAQEHWQLTRPLCLFFLAAAVRRDTSHEVDILDLERLPYRGVELETPLAEVGTAQVFGITATTYSRFEAFEVARVLRRLYPDSLIVTGGVHFTFTATETLDEVPEVDIVVRGEGERTLVQILESLEADGGLDGVKGISYRADGRIAHNPPQDEFQDPDVTAYAFDHTWDEYPEYLFGVSERVPAISIMASRGCPFNCAFCAKSETRYVARSAVRVVDEIEQLAQGFGIDAFNFLDLSFTVEARHVRELCEEILARGLHIKWWCESRANTPPKLVELMQKAGCVSTVVGVESGSPRVVSSISKGISVEQAIRFCKTCHEVGVGVQPYFMYSLPGETREDAERTLDLIDRLEEFTLPASFQPCMVFPGTEVAKIAADNGSLDGSFSWAEPYHSELNVELGQLPNIPLFIDRMTEEDLRELAARRLQQHQRRWENANLRLAVDNASQMSFVQLAGKVVRNALTGKRVWRYAFSPSLMSQFLRARRTRCKDPTDVGG